MFDSDLAVIITLSGLLIVFFVLVLLVATIKMFGVLFSGNKTKKEKPAERLLVKENKPAVLPAVVRQDDEVIAVISAAVYAYSLSSNKTYTVRSIRPAKTERTSRPAWATSGVIQNTKPF